MIERLEAINNKYKEIQNELSKPEVLSDIKRMTELSKEQTRLGNIVEVYDKYKQVNEDILSAKEMLHDSEMAEFAREELTNLETELSDINKRLEVMLLPHDPNVEMKQIFLLVIYLICILSMLITKDGKLKY